MSKQLFEMADEDKWNRHYVLAENIEQAVEGYKKVVGFLPSNVHCLDTEFIDFIDATNKEFVSKSEQRRLEVQRKLSDRHK